MDGGSPVHSQNSDGKGKTRKLMRRVSTLDSAVAKANLAKELANQKKVDLQIAAEWSEILKKPEERTDPRNCERLWREVKTRLIRRYNTIHSAFKHIDSSGDGSISNIEFNNMLQQINFPMPPRVCRAVFEQASGGDRSLSMSELKKLLMAKTIRKLNFLMDNFNGKQERVQTHMHNFLQRLAEADDASRIRGVDRFQRKLTIAFCRDLWHALVRSLRKPPSQDLPVERSLLGKVIDDWVGIRLQGYECTFILRVFDRIDCRKRGSVAVSSLITQLVLLSQEQDKGAKIALIFEMFDTDYDGCLLYEQILAMFRCICSQRPFAEISAAGVQRVQSNRDVAFQEELSAQEGLRAYERARWYLQRSCKVEGGIVSLRELWESLSMQPAVLNDLIPGVVRIRWAMEPSSVEEDMNEAPPSRQLALRRTVTDPSPGLTGGQERRKGSKLASATWSGGNHRTGPVVAFASTTCIGFGRAETPASRQGGEANRFKKTVMTKFQTSLRSFGDQRLQQLTSGEIPRVIDQSEDSETLVRSHSTPRNSSRRMPPIKSASAPNLSACASVSSPRGSIDLPPISVPIIHGDKWGSEAAERFRLFCNVTNSFGKHAPNPTDVGIGVGYRCQLCRHFHHISVGCA